MYVHPRINRFLRSLIETFFEREKRTYLKKCLKMPLSKHYNSGNSPLGHLHLWSGDTKLGTEIWSHDVCICYLYWRDTSIQGTLASGPEGFPCVRFWQNVSRGCPLNVEVLLYALFTGRIKLFPRQTIEEPRWTGVTVSCSQKCFHGIIKSSSKPTDVVRGSKPCEVVAFGARNRAFVWYRAGQ